MMVWKLFGLSMTLFGLLLENSMNKLICFAVVSSLALAGCGSYPSSDEIQNQKQEELSKQGVQSVGLPAIKNFQEKRILKDILELQIGRAHV